MRYTAELTFLCKLLKDLHISSCVLEDPRKEIPAQIDLGLRAGLYGDNNYVPFLQNSFDQAKDHTVYRFYDEYDCIWIALCLWMREN